MTSEEVSAILVEAAVRPTLVRSLLRQLKEHGVDPPTSGVAEVLRHHNWVYRAAAGDLADRR